MDFLQNHIMTRFGVPISLVFDNASYFCSIRLTAFSNERGIKLHYFANYQPQGNGLVESTNKNLIRILKNTMIENQISWNLAQPNALWADRVTPKNSLGVSLYTLVYGKQACWHPNNSPFIFQNKGPPLCNFCKYFVFGLITHSLCCLFLGLVLIFMRIG